MEFITGQIYKLKETVLFRIHEEHHLNNGKTIKLPKGELLTFLSVTAKRSHRDNSKYVYVKKFIYDNQYVYDSTDTYDYPFQYFDHVTIID